MTQGPDPGCPLCAEKMTRWWRKALDRLAETGELSAADIVTVLGRGPRPQQVAQFFRGLERGEIVERLPGRAGFRLVQPDVVRRLLREEDLRIERDGWKPPRRSGRDILAELGSPFLPATPPTGAG